MSEQTPRDDGEIFTLVDEAGNEELYKEAMRFQSPETGWTKKTTRRLRFRPLPLKNLLQKKTS